MAVPLRLPDNVRLEYMAEGAANIVYRILEPAESLPDPSSIAYNTTDQHALPSPNSAGTPPPSEIEPFSTPSDIIPSAALAGKLLRLHKDVPWIPSYASLHKTFAINIAPLFEPSSTITQDLVLLPPSLLEDCNAALRLSESADWLTHDHSSRSIPVVHSLPRPPARHGLYLSITDPHGLLIEDMSPSPIHDEVLFELKPKWLAQSPTAPQSSKRCRTCALRAKREAKAAQKEHCPTKSIIGRAGLRTTFCPLDLVSENEKEVEAAVANVLEAQLVASHEMQLRDPTIFKGLQSGLSHELYTNPLLRRLRDLQRTLDPHGVLALDQQQQNLSKTYGDTSNIGTAVSTATDSAIQLSNHEAEADAPKPDLPFLIATTLRDCTLFLRVRFLPPAPPPPRRQLSGEREAVRAILTEDPKYAVQLDAEEVVDLALGFSNESSRKTDAQGEGRLLDLREEDGLYNRFEDEAGDLLVDDKVEEFNADTAMHDNDNNEIYNDDDDLVMIEHEPPGRIPYSDLDLDSYSDEDVPLSTVDPTKNDPNLTTTKHLKSTSNHSILQQPEVQDAAAHLQDTIHQVQGFTRDAAQGPGLSITIKLGDLDLKEAEEGKMKYWSGVERGLIEGGWYEALDGADVGCALGR